jgi:hypothetical protein
MKHGSIALVAASLGLAALMPASLSAAEAEHYVATLTPLNAVKI